MWTAIRASAALLLLSAGAASAGPCRDMSYAGHDYTVCEAGPEADLRLYLQNDDGLPIGTFDRLSNAVKARGHELAFAMNAGMYHPDRSPVGLYVENGVAEGRLITSAGPGNFGLLPNGVFCIADGHYAVVETLRFKAEAPECRYATQSGPMLVIDGEIHPRFLKDSDSRYIRNGVGVTPDGSRAVFVISDDAVNFDEFARAFRDGLGLPNALYFDGHISRLYAPALGRDDFGFPMGPMVGLALPLPD